MPRDPQATRLPEDWMPTPELRNWAMQSRPDLRGYLDEIIEDFKDYWLSAGGANARKTDWDRTFKRWIRNTSPPKRPKTHPNESGGGVVL